MQVQWLLLMFSGMKITPSLAAETSLRVVVGRRIPFLGVFVFA
ncbi:hypothetical protein F441_22731 [Phytophthora nicotianae CJ01A1]|uniref:Uncharacterized protein n=1 Tax=Phytophthora nicotianae CJ01A1 TaxID=1317063 RepID=W2VNU0_PHYNI|nr:hypothetical protein F441_22731 [Phytophthora nicotianae CJ01A1]